MHKWPSIPPSTTAGQRAPLISPLSNTFSHSLPLLLLLFQTPEPSKNIPSPTQTQSPLSPNGGSAEKTHIRKTPPLVQKIKVGNFFFQNAFSSRSLLFSRPVKEVANYLLFMCLGDLGKIIGRPIQTYLRERAHKHQAPSFICAEKSVEIFGVHHNFSAFLF